MAVKIPDGFKFTVKVPGSINFIPITINLDDIKKRHQAATPGPWQGRVNYPFYGVLIKPAPSLSKHDQERPSYWRMEDVVFVVSAHADITYLLSEIDRLQKAIPISEKEI
jgi:hypothetical protein